jgi:hypothetical protein
VSVKENLQNLRARIADAARSCGRRPEDIRLVAVTKTVPPEIIDEAIEAGVTEIGENRVQEAKTKVDYLKQKYPRVTWHLVGHLQRNKVGQALDIFDIIQSVDSERLLAEINQRTNETVPILIEVNTSGETSKFGIEPDQAVNLVRLAASFDKIKVLGLMTVGPLVADPEKARPSFRKLRELKAEIESLGLPGSEKLLLSMGMSDDFSVAIQEGANLLRIGRAIFGQR